MLPKLLRVVQIARFSKIAMTQGNKADVSGMQNISQLPFYQHFREGLNLTISKQLQQANTNFQQALNLLDSQQQQLSDHYLHIYQKMMANNLAMGKISSVESNIYELIKLKKKLNVQGVLIYDDYLTLFRLHLKYKPQKAVLLGRALLTEQQIQSMSFSHKKQFLYLLGNAYLLIGNYADAKARYSQCLENSPNATLKTQTLNSLAIACWWHKNPLFAQPEQQTATNKMQTVDSEFKQTREILLRALETSQSQGSLRSVEQGYELGQLLGQKQFSLSALLKQESSVKPLYNLVQYYINNQPANKMKIMNWLRILLKLSKSTNQESIFDESYTHYCVLNNDKIELLRFAEAASQKYRDQLPEVYFNRLLALLVPQNTQESQKLITRNRQIQQKILASDPSAFKRKYIHEEPVLI